MNQDEEEFFDLVGAHSNQCGQLLHITIIDKKTGEHLADDLPVRCGLIVASDTGPEDTKCFGCDKHVVLCDCGDGINLGYVGNGKHQVCTNDGFCKRGKCLPRDQFESHDEDFTPSGV